MSDERLLDILSSFREGRRILVLGDVMLDRFVYGSVERMSPEAPVPVMRIEGTSATPGGAANVARNVAAVGGQAVLIGVVGPDEPAEELQAQLAEMSSIDAQLVTDQSRPTTLKTRYLADRQQVLRTDVESTAPLGARTAEAILERYCGALAQSDIVIFSDYGKGVLTDTVTSAAIAAATRAGKRVIVDPKSKLFAKYRGATVLTPNRHELQSACAHECSSDEQVVAGCREILAQGLCETLVVTRGRDGMSIVQGEGEATHIRTVATEVFDVTGAGDTAVAVMAVSLASGAGIGQAAHLANVAAGIVVGKYGTATATAEEMLARLSGAGHPHAADDRFSLERVQQLVARWRRLGLRVAFTNGCFDLLHPGHVSLLHQARETADRLVVGLNSDLSVRRLKGAGRPIQSAAARAMVLTSLKSVDAVVIFEEDTPRNLIATLEPDVLVKGADYSIETVVGADLVLKRGGKVVLAELVPAHSTTDTIHRVASVAKM